MKPWHEIVFGSVFAIAGIVFLIYSIFMIKNHIQKSKFYIETTSTVVDYAYNSNGLSVIVVEYSVDNQVYRKNSDIYSSNPKSLGTSVKIKYNPDNPSNTIWVSNNFYIILILVGTLFEVIGILFIGNSVNRKNKFSL